MSVRWRSWVQNLLHETMMGSLRIVRVDRYLNPETHRCPERSILVCCFHFLHYFFLFGGGHKIFFRAEEDVSASEVLNKHEEEMNE